MRGSRRPSATKLEESFVAGAALFKRTTGGLVSQMQISLEWIAPVGAGFWVKRRAAAERA